MTTDPVLLDELRALLASYGGIVEKRITAGVGFMWRGNLLCGVMRDELLVRVDKGDGAAYVGEDAAHPMVMGGRASTGWILVPMPTTGREALIARWLQRAVEHGARLPPK